MCHAEMQNEKPGSQCKTTLMKQILQYWKMVSYKVTFRGGWEEDKGKKSIYSTGMKQLNETEILSWQ